MKILHIIPSYIPAKFASGPILPTHFLNRALVQQGVDVTVYTTNLDKWGKMDVPIGEEVNIDGVKVYYFAAKFSAWFYAPQMQRFIKKNVKNFDLIHITSVFLSASALGVYFSKKFNKPCIISPHGSLMVVPLQRHAFIKRMYILLVEKNNLKNAVMQFTSEIEKNQFIKTNLPCKSAFILPNVFESPAGAVDAVTDKFFLKKKLGLPDDSRIVLFLGRIDPIKGIDSLIPAFKLVVQRHPNARLVIAGPDAVGYKSKLLRLAVDEGVADKVYFPGMLSGRDKVLAYNGSDVFVAPSYSENFGMSILEAMSCGLPVVITKSVGIAPIVQRSGAGAVVEKNYRQLAAAIDQFLDSPKAVKEVVNKAKKLINDEFSAKKVAQKFIQVYNSLINGR